MAAASRLAAPAGSRRAIFASLEFFDSGARQCGKAPAGLRGRLVDADGGSQAVSKTGQFAVDVRVFPVGGFQFFDKASPVALGCVDRFPFADDRIEIVESPV